MTLTARRAKEIWENRGPAGDLSRAGLTPEEDKEVRRVWDLMKPGWTSWSTAFFHIMKGGTDEQARNVGEGKTD